MAAIRASKHDWSRAPKQSFLRFWGTAPVECCDDFATPFDRFVVSEVPNTAGVKHQWKAMGGYWGHWLWNLHPSGSENHKSICMNIYSRFGKTITSPLACRLSLLQRISYLWFLKLVVRRNHRFIQTYLCIYSRCVYFGVKLVHISCIPYLCVFELSGQKAFETTYSVCNLILPLSVLHQLGMIPRSIEHSSNCLGSRRGRNIHATETCRIFTDKVCSDSCTNSQHCFQCSDRQFAKQKYISTSDLKWRTHWPHLPRVCLKVSVIKFWDPQINLQMMYWFTVLLENSSVIYNHI